MKPKTDFQMMLIHLREAASLLPSASAALSLQERRRFIVEKTVEICNRAKCRVRVSDIVELVRLPHEQVVEALRKSSAFDVATGGAGMRARLYVKLKEGKS